MPATLELVPTKEQRQSAFRLGLLIETDGTPTVWRFVPVEKPGSWSVGHYVPVTLWWWTPGKRGQTESFRAVLKVMTASLAEMRARRQVGEVGFWWRG